MNNNIKTIPMTDFSLSWRWTDPRYDVLPTEILRQIIPLSPDSATMISENATIKCRGNINGIRIEANRATAERLRNLEITGTTEIYISWSEDTAVITTWSVFCNFYETFCYPYSDDVTIWPKSQEWSLCYFHDEYFIFRKI